MEHPKIERCGAVLKRLSISRSNLYNKISKGLWPQPVQLGARAVGWQHHETDTMIAAMAAGKSDEDLKQIVDSLIENRKKTLKGVIA